jgi:hypothetical protein
LYHFPGRHFFEIPWPKPLLYRFARRLGFRKLTAVFLVAVLLLINTPLLRTIRHTQVNLIVLDLVLIGLLVADRLSLVSGFSIAAGVHLKLYPAVLFVPWLLARRWRAIFWGLVGLGLLIIANAAWGQNWALWDQFLAASQSFPPGNQFRDNSLHSLVFNGLAFLAAPLGMSGSMVRTIVSIVVIALSIILSGWIGLRIFRRQRSLAEGAISAELLYFSQAMDVLALGLLLAPRIWEHHYVLAVPVVLWGTAVAGEKKPWLVGTAALLMLSLPTFDIFPLSYHRLAGLLLMLCLTSDKSRPDDIGPALF